MTQSDDTPLPLDELAEIEARANDEVAPWFLLNARADVLALTREVRRLRALFSEGDARRCERFANLRQGGYVEDGDLPGMFYLATRIRQAIGEPTEPKPEAVE